MRIDRTAEVITIPTFNSWDNSELRNRLEDRPTGSTLQAELQEIARQKEYAAEATKPSRRGRKR